MTATGQARPHRAVDVLVVGRANVDLTVRVPRPPAAGRSVVSSGLVVSPGGKSLNQAIAVSALGGSSSLVANVGADEWGRFLRSALEKGRVDVTGVRLLSGVGTGAALVHLTPDGESYVVLALSPATELTADEVHRALAGVDFSVLVTQLDLPPEAVAAVLSDRRPQPTVGNLIPHHAVTDDQLARLDLIVMNQHEAAEFLGVGPVDALDAARRLRERGPTASVVTAGADGAAYSAPGMSGTVPADQVPVVDTTGAGDAFLAALALGIARLDPLPVAVAEAVRVGTAAVQIPGPLYVGTRG
ncbi:MAG: PfkB family carbohydrate kinase [Nocardioides sp.]